MIFLKLFLSLVIFLNFIYFPFISAFSLFEQVSNLEETYIKRVAISSLNPSLICVASKNSLYISQDGGKNFKRVAVFKDEEIKHLFQDKFFADTFYIATTRHLYKIKKDYLERIFSSSEDEVVYTAAKSKNNLFIGTNKGIYYAQEDFLNWKKLKRMQDTAVYYLEAKDDILYLVTSKGVYIFKDGQIERVFVIREEEGYLFPQLIKVDLFDDKKVWLATTKGLFFSQDEGKSWYKFYAPLIDNLSIRCIKQTKQQKDTLYLASSKGFFKLNTKEKKVDQIFEGLSSSSINWIEINSGRIWLATDKGLFKSNYFSYAYTGDLEKLLEKEPSIEEIQEAALRYNEVHPEKIRRWRNALKIRALFPQISLDYDKTINYDSGSDRYYIGPRDWGISFSWDVGDLIWNPYEDDVDVRSKLTTQLRLDILDEINRVYFERLRIKYQILSSSLSQEDLFKKKLRLKELTAILDGYTGGYFSRRLKELNNK
jgi:ligand-binding sensor domain-containing protein